MSDELVIQQPQSGMWLSPGKRIGHLVAFFKCTEKEKRFDNMSQKEKEVATFEFVDLDQECDLMVGLDNHPGITNKLVIGNPCVVLGRIQTAPSQFANDAVVLGEHESGDAARLQAWHKLYKAGVKNSAASTPGTPVVPAPTTEAPAIDITKLDEGTLALIQKQMAAKAAGG